jgi:hypothetical protein
MNQKREANVLSDHVRQLTENPRQAGKQASQSHRGKQRRGEKERIRAEPYIEDDEINHQQAKEACQLLPFSHISHRKSPETIECAYGNAHKHSLDASSSAHRPPGLGGRARPASRSLVNVAAHGSRGCQPAHVHVARVAGLTSRSIVPHRCRHGLAIESVRGGGGVVLRPRRGALRHGIHRVRRAEHVLPLSVHAGGRALMAHETTAAGPASRSALKEAIPTALAAMGLRLVVGSHVRVALIEVWVVGPWLHASLRRLVDLGPVSGGHRQGTVLALKELRQGRSHRLTTMARPSMTVPLSWVRARAASDSVANVTKPKPLEPRSLYTISGSPHS